MPEAIANRQRPRLSELGIDLLQLSHWQVVRCIAWPFIAFASYWICSGMGIWSVAVFSLIVLSFVTYGSTSHDLVHGSLGLNRLPNDILLSVIEAISLRSGHAYRACHLNHHARFPHMDDIEADASRMTLRRALFEGVIFQLRTYLWALRRPQARRNWIIAEGIAVLVMLIAAVSASPWTIIPLVYVALMIAGSWIIPLITSYLPHNSEAADEIHQTRFYRGLIFRVFALDHLYHLEHHLYPIVPHQNWPRLARRLDPWLESVGLKPSQLWH